VPPDSQVMASGTRDRRPTASPRGSFVDLGEVTLSLALASSRAISFGLAAPRFRSGFSVLPLVAYVLTPRRQALVCL
jgi:hypothetical protein